MGQQKTEIVTVRFTKAEKAELKKSGEKMGMALATFVRYACFYAGAKIEIRKE